MLYAYDSGNLEIRRGGGSTRISGSFPYNSRAVLSDGGRRGRPKKEYFASRAFRHSVESEEQEIHLLVGHDFGKPLASKLSGSLRLTDTDDALRFEATLASQLLDTTHGRDAMNMLSAGVVGGISPGFRIPPERTVPNAERVFNEPPEEGTAVIREINDAILFEISLVTRPAYPATQVEARNWRTLPEPVEKAVRFISQQRWR